MLLANKLIEKILDPCNAKEYCQWFIRKKNTKSVITEHPKTSQNLSKTIMHAEKVGTNSPFYSDTKKVKIFQRKKM